VAWSATMNRERFLDLVRSRSYFITASADEQRETIAKLEQLLAEHPDLVGRDELEVPYLTRCFRARLA
ncbi:MAG TPA: SAM-dependent methyltransferase, partial [Agromyces sp.]